MAITGDGRCYTCQNWNASRFNKLGNPEDYWAACKLENCPVKNKENGLTIWTNTCDSFIKVKEEMMSERKAKRKKIS